MKLLSSFILVSSLAFASPQDYGFVYNLQDSIKGNDSVLVDVEINSFTSKVAEVVLPPFVAHTNNQALHLTAEQTQKIDDSAEAIQLFGPRISLIETSTNHWNTAYSWGDHALAGYLLPADLLPYATMQQVAEAGYVTAVVTNGLATTQQVTLAVAPLIQQLDAIEVWPTNDWQMAYGWGNHAVVGYLLPADLLPYATVQMLADALAPMATTQQVAEAVSDAVTNLNLYAVPVVGGKHELWVKE